MEANKILKADLLDILFENRNKAYGAYELRSTYSTRIKKSMIAMGAVCLVFTTGVLLANSTSKEVKASIPVIDVTLSNVKEKEEIKPVIVPPKEKPVEVKTLAVTIPKIVPDKDLEHTEVPPDDQIEKVTISNVTKDGVDIGDALPPVLEASTGGVTEIKSKEPDFTKEFITVQKQAEFPGGINEWVKFLTRNLNTETPIENGAPTGKYTVTLSFLVDRDGSISEVKALNDPGYGTVEEAIRVIKKSRQWIPALQNGNNVIYRQKQSITFIVNEG